MNQIILTDYTPGALGRIVQLHGAYYGREWGLELYFEAKVATELAAFLNRFEAIQDGAWFAQTEGQIVGGIFIDGSDAYGKGARLRWFILDPAYQGRGIGQQLIDAAVAFCDQQQFPRVYLTTFAGLTAARHLYEKAGFKLCGEEDARDLTGSADLVEQIFEYFPREMLKHE